LLPPATRTALLAEFSDRELTSLEHDWRVWARPAQLPPPGDWRTWLLMGGRGSGKSRAGAEWVRAEVEAGRCGRVALVSETAADARDVMVEGPAGLLAIASPGWRPTYEPSKRRLTWPNGAVALTFSSEAPEQLRGPQFEAAWADEVGKWGQAEATWDNLQFGLRLGDRPVCVATTTPRRVPLLRALLDDPATVVTHQRTADNAAHLAPSFLAYVVGRYGGTRLGRQELDGELIETVDGALWDHDALDRLRVRQAPALRRVVVAVDPPGESGPTAAEAGIVVAGLGHDGHGYVLADLSKRGTPAQWAAAAVAAYHAHQCDRLIAEVNHGGAMVGATIGVADRTVAYRAVRASRGKQARAEPVSALYEAGRVHHVGGFAALEDQMTTWTPDDTESPDRLDALVWALTDLLLGGHHGAAAF
jgi:phage terminase large subunit-like protein